jgi:6-phosphogluconolactonase
MNFSVETFATSDEWKNRAVELFRMALKEAIGRGQSAFNACLAGGTTPKPVYEAIAADPAVIKMEASIAVHLWVGDERNVPTDSPYRNGKMIAEVFGARAAAARARLDTSGASNIAGIPVAVNPIAHLWPASEREKACAEFSEEIVAAMGLKPVFDLALLGMGNDGHTAGIFAIPTASSGEEPLAFATQAPSEPRERMTLGAETLRRSRAILVLLAGREKKAALDAASLDLHLPISYVAGKTGRFIYLENL